MTHPPRTWLIRLGTVAFILCIIFCLLFTFGLSAGDEAAFRSFEAAAARWQINPEFRSMATEYSVRGSESMRAHLFFIPAKRVIMGMRSLPFVRKTFAVNPTSRQHYQDFSQGPLSAYLHLCAEQDVHDMTGIFTAAGRNAQPLEADLRSVLAGFKMDQPVVCDIGARQSVADVLRDTDAGRGFPIADNIGPRLAEPIGHIAAQLRLPADPAQMTAEQQQVVFDRLDSYIHSADPELWRTKQINDFCIGIWAQVYGPEYKTAILPILLSHDASKILLFVLLGMLLIRVSRRPSIPETNLLSEDRQGARQRQE